MSPVLEVIIQILGFVLAGWFLYSAYTANKKAEPFSFRSMKLSPDFRDLYFAKGFVAGIVIIILLVHKLLTCGLICWS